MFTLLSIVIFCMLWLFCIFCIFFFLKTLRIFCLECCSTEDIDSYSESDSQNVNTPNTLVIINPNNSINIATTFD